MCMQWNLQSVCVSFRTSPFIIAVVNSELLKRCCKAKPVAPAYSRALTLFTSTLGSFCIIRGRISVAMIPLHLF